jgi:hypothetical protein
MTTSTPHRRTVKLPLGYGATFAFSPETGLACQWHPGIPSIESARAWRRFYAAYVAERDAFLAEIATMLDGAVLIADVKGGKITGSTVIRPEPLQ